MPKQRPSSTPVDVEIGTRIRSCRVAAGITQSGLARQLGITFQQVQKYEKGRNRVALSRALAIASALRCRLADFIPAAAANEASALVIGGVTADDLNHPAQQ